MSISNTETPPSPESTYLSGGNPAANREARQLFFISVGSSAVPVLVAAVIMLQGGHGLSSKTVSAPFAQKAPVRAIAPLAAEPHAAPGSAKVPAPPEPFADHTAAPRPALISSSTLPVKEDSVTTALPHSATVAELSAIRSLPLANPADVVGRFQASQSGNDILQRSAPLSLALVSVPVTSSIHGADAVAVEEPNAESRTTGVAASPAKKIHAETHAHPIAHHRHRPQKHAPPSLLAKIGQSVKKGLLNVAKFPRQAMERRSWD